MAGLQTSKRRLSFRIHSSKDVPQDRLYRVLSHYHWFWTDLADLKSKVLIEVLYSLFYLQPGASKPGDEIFMQLSGPRIPALNEPIIDYGDAHEKD